MAGPDAPDAARSAPEESRWPTWLALALVVLLVVGVRARFAAVPLERDEGEYAVFGRLILQGQVPYVAAYNMKLPGVYYAYAVILAVFGEWDVGIRLGAMLITSASAVLVFAVGRRIAGDRAGLFAALSFGLFSASSRTLGFTANAEHFVVVFMLAGLWVLSGGGERPRAGRLLLAGVLFGLAVLMKQHAVFFAAFGFGWVILSSAGQRLRRGLAFGMGLVIPYAITALYFAAEGAFDQFWFWTVTYARDYTQQTSLVQGAQALAHVGRPIIVSQWPTLLLAVCGLAVSGQVAREWQAWLWLCLGVSFLATCPGLIFREHYFLLTAPAVAWLAGAGTEWIVRQFFSTRPVLGTGLAALAVLAGVLLLEAPLLAASPREISRRCYGTNAFPETVEIAEFLKRHTRPDEPIAVLGSEPQIYFYAQRPAATGYIYTYALMEIHPHARRMQREMIRELETQRPRYFVYVSTPHSWLARPGSVHELHTWIERVLDPRCRVVGRVNILTEDGHTYESRALWGPEAASAKPTSPLFFLVLERLER